MAAPTIRDCIEILLEHLSSIKQTNGYFTNLGDNVVANQGRVFQSQDDILNDTINLVDEGVEWEKVNHSLVRVHTLTCQFYLLPDAGQELNDKIYDGIEDIEKMMVSMEGNVPFYMMQQKAQMWPDARNRDIALIEFTIQLKLSLNRGI